MSNAYRIVLVNGHYEVYFFGRFQFSADTMSEVYEEINQDGVNDGRKEN